MSMPNPTSIPARPPAPQKRSTARIDAAISLNLAFLHLWFFFDIASLWPLTFQPRSSHQHTLGVLIKPGGTACPCLVEIPFPPRSTKTPSFFDTQGICHGSLGDHVRPFVFFHRMVTACSLRTCLVVSFHILPWHALMLHQDPERTNRLT